MKKIIVALVCFAMLSGCAGMSVVPGDNLSSLDKLKLAVSALDTVVNVVGPIVIINLCVYVLHLRTDKKAWLTTRLQKRNQIAADGVQALAGQKRFKP